MTRLYLDHAATSPLRPEVAMAMAPWWDARFGNAASAHAEGRRAKAALAEARAQVGALVGAQAADVVFTSGATEASNLAVRGAAHIRRAGGKRVTATAIEHAATRACCEQLAVEGWEVRFWGVDGVGRVAETELPHGTAVVSVIAGHNELGTIQPLEMLAEAAHRVGAYFHLDAVQAAGYLDLSGVSWDLLSLSAHKLGGPQGVGALVRRDRLDVSPVLVGGNQEYGLRPGTVPVALAVGFGVACALAAEHRAFERKKLARWRDRLGQMLLDTIPRAQALGPWLEAPDDALPHILPIGVGGFAGDELVYALDRAGVAASSASACLSGARSQTLDAIGAPEDVALLRLSLGWNTAEADIAVAMSRVPRAIADLAAQSPFQRRAGILERQAEGVVSLSAAHWEAAEAVFGFYRDEGILPGPRALAKLGAAAQVSELFPYGLSTLALWLGLPVPRGGCRPYAG